MKQMELLRDILTGAIEGKKTINLCDDYKLFSFEGLPGAGKTTQLYNVEAKLKSDGFNVGIVDLPTENGVGLALRAMYIDKSRWKQIAQQNKWLNAILITLDLITALDAMRGCDCVLMTRGLLSTYYYNIGIIEGETEFNTAVDSLSRLLVSFPRPKAIFFLNVCTEQAHARVVTRNREPLRDMDYENNMKSDLNKLRNLSKRLNKIPFYEVNGEKMPFEVTDDIVSIMYNERFISRGVR